MSAYDRPRARPVGGGETGVNSTLGISPITADFVKEGESGKDFSSDFDSTQVSAHDAVSLFQRYAKGGDNPDLKDWAAKTLPALSHHLETAQNLKKSK
jgi:predicted outer membrane protein